MLARQFLNLKRERGAPYQVGNHLFSVTAIDKT